MNPKARNLNIELLRCVAIFSIAIFHTFVPYFNALAYGAFSAGVSIGMKNSFIALFCMGLINFLGSLGNFIFYMISGFFLIPHAIKELGAGFWIKQIRSIGRRCIVIVGSVIVFAILTIFLHFVCRMPSAKLNGIRWLGSDLEFIWLYLIFCVLSPFVALLQSKWKRGWAAFLACVLVLTFLCNAFIAFFSQGGVNHALDGWRKLMSAVTYLWGFCLAGLAGEKGWSKNRKRSREIFLICLFSALISTFICALAQSWKMAGDLSFKSTSLISFGAALSLLLLSASKEKKNSEFKAAKAITFFANGILGFYIFQSMLTSFWHLLIFPVINSLSLPGFFPFVALFIFASLLTLIYTLILSAIGSWVRRPLLAAGSRLLKS
ncbi:MAG: acyltransferase family protein [Aeriscardovia sp.]|nr:acyltransferase family protein [Aeriscardovia sp.]MBO6071641.1 acyltransferase family protein [Aeriscardovia sp.]